MFELLVGTVVSLIILSVLQGVKNARLEDKIKDVRDLAFSGRLRSLTLLGRVDTLEKAVEETLRLRRVRLKYFIEDDEYEKEERHVRRALRESTNITTFLKIKAFNDAEKETSDA